MKLTPKQAQAVAHLKKHPKETPDGIASAIGTSRSHNNPATFVERMVNSGIVRLVPTDEALAALEEREQ